MPAQKKTSLGLNQWIGSEYPKRVDFVEDNKIINDELENRVKYTDLAEENKAGIITYAKIKEIAPKPDLSPYIPFSKGYRNSNNSDYIIRANQNESWLPMILNLYASNGDYVGSFKINGAKAYYKASNKNGGNWIELMDKIDMSGRDNRMDSIDENLKNVWKTFNNDTVREIRMTALRTEQMSNINSKNQEIGGYLVTGFNNNGSTVHRRVMQVRRGGNGQFWLNVIFA